MLPGTGGVDLLREFCKEFRDIAYVTVAGVVLVSEEVSVIRHPCAIRYATDSWGISVTVCEAHHKDV